MKTRKELKEEFSGRATAEISRLEDLFMLDFADLIEITDEDISARIPPLDILGLDQINEDPRNRSSRARAYP